MTTREQSRAIQVEAALAAYKAGVGLSMESRIKQALDAAERAAWHHFDREKPDGISSIICPTTDSDLWQYKPIPPQERPND